MEVVDRTLDGDGYLAQPMRGPSGKLKVHRLAGAAAAPTFLAANNPPAFYGLVAEPPREYFNHPDDYQPSPDELKVLETCRRAVAPTLEEHDRALSLGTIAPRNLNGETRKRLYLDNANPAGVPPFDFLMTVKAAMQHLDRAERFLAAPDATAKVARRYIPAPEYTHYALRDVLVARDLAELLPDISPKRPRTRLNVAVATALDPQLPIYPDLRPTAGAQNKNNLARIEEDRVMHLFPAYYHINSLSQGLYRLFTAHHYQLRDLWSNQLVGELALPQVHDGHAGAVENANPDLLYKTPFHLVAFHNFAATLFRDPLALGGYYGITHLEVADGDIGAFPVAANWTARIRTTDAADAPISIMRATGAGLWPRHGGAISRGTRSVQDATLLANVAALGAPTLTHPRELLAIQPYVKDFHRAMRETRVVRYLLRRFDVIIQAFANSVPVKTNLAATDLVRAGEYSSDRLVRKCAPGMRIVYMDAAGKDLPYNRAVTSLHGVETLQPAARASRCEPSNGALENFSGAFGATRARAVSRTAVLARARVSSHLAQLKPRRAVLAALPAWRASRRKRQARSRAAVVSRRGRRAPSKAKAKSQAAKSRRGRTPAKSQSRAKSQPRAKAQPKAKARARTKAAKSRRGRKAAKAAKAAKTAPTPRRRTR